MTLYVLVWSEQSQCSYQCLFFFCFGFYICLRAHKGSLGAENNDFPVLIHSRGSSPELDICIEIGAKISLLDKCDARQCPFRESKLGNWKRLRRR
jgi:hypothetical protein